MTTTIVPTDNSRISIPKKLFKESGVGTQAIIETKKGEIRIISMKGKKVNENALLSEKTLAADWNRPEEDTAWKNLL